MTDLFILLTTAEADAVRGETSPGAWLAPVPLADGITWVLPCRVLLDPGHEAKWPLLAGLPQGSVAPEEWALPDSPEIP